MKRNPFAVLILVFALGAAGIFNLGANGKADEKKDGSVPMLEVWWAGYSQFEAEGADHPFVQRAVKELGIGWERPTVPWGGGTDYGERLKLRLAAAASASPN